ncbi:MAG: UDP-2,3-diacylglucosamine hydrolase [Flavobacteriaceae bacterium]|nr:UDP-2,3-diacylglucosamine hydrolase [Flavobacteriaceae bacterium]|tara:strand:+ start:4580 stop:5353 length:774 start_codon:yes stop_codon:yes gene_type:complete
MHTLVIKKNKKVYFSSDQHFGAPNEESSKKREKLFLKWLNRVEKDAGALFLLGDLFDFWFEYKKVVPKGFVRILGKLANISDSGIPIYFFVGNHDLWMDNYFSNELNIKVFYKPQEFTINNKSFLIGHGDGLGPGDFGYKRMKKVFTNPIMKTIFRWIHPDLGVKLAQYLSINNKLISGNDDRKFYGPEKEIIFQYVIKKNKEKVRDFYIFGHRHLALEIPLNKSLYINLGDWITHFTYGEFFENQFSIKRWRTADD